MKVGRGEGVEGRSGHSGGEETAMKNLEGGLRYEGISKDLQEERK